MKISNIFYRVALIAIFARSSNYPWSAHLSLLKLFSGAPRAFSLRKYCISMYTAMTNWRLNAKPRNDFLFWNCPRLSSFVFSPFHALLFGGEGIFPSCLSCSVEEGFFSVDRAEDDLSTVESSGQMLVMDITAAVLYAGGSKSEGKEPAHILFISKYTEQCGTWICH